MNKLSTVLLLGLLGSSAAQANLINNGGFELPGTLAAAPGYQYLPNNNTSVTNWTAISDGIGEESYLMNKNRSNGSYLPRVYDGTYAVAIGTGNAMQTTVALTAGTTYDLSFAARPNVTGASNLQVTLDNFSTSIAATSNFVVYQYQFTAATSNPAAILKFFNPSANGGNRIWALDNVSLTAVPVPGAFWLFGSSLAGLLWSRQRRALAA